ncbi:Spastin [Arthrobotrys entomopaga]|nr:Spastin [Arthrobotrys entomopaga]
MENSEQKTPVEDINEVKLLERQNISNDPDSDNYWSTKLYELGKGPVQEKKKTTKVEVPAFDNYTFRCIDQKARGYSGRVLEIKSEVVKKLLEEVVTGYPHISFSEPTVKINLPSDELWIFRDELNKRAQQEGEKGTELGQHLAVLMKFLNDEWAPFSEKVGYWTDLGLITYKYLWTLFRPGSYIYTTVDGQPRVLKSQALQYQSDCSGKKWAEICGDYIDYDGNKFGRATTEFRINEFHGTRKIVELKVFPLDKHTRKEVVVKRLIDRGTKFVGLQDYHCKMYNGITANGVSINTRVMVDAKSHGNKYLSALASPDFEEDEGSDRYHDEEGNLIERPVKKKHLDLTDDQKLICTAVIPGFTLDDHKKWFELFIDEIQDIQWNPEIFSKLVLPDETKQLIRGLVESHRNEETKFDDFVKGKGKGLIAVLHGPPGLGKTMTAETVAEYTKSPLYTISAGNLGTDPYGLESNLRRILDLAERWNAVLLLDEADVYLEARSIHDIQRNSLVSIFLRLVEYYQGILFLTTNRVTTFDDAFQSRIHVALRYSSLSVDARQKIWRNFITRMDQSRVAVTEEDYKVLSSVDLNGRQIKNAIRTAISIAETNREVLSLKHFQIVFGVMASFGQDLKLESLPESRKRPGDDLQSDSEMKLIECRNTAGSMDLQFQRSQPTIEIRA